ncbi:MAG TPA: hypothetical protein VGB37_06055 [Candidatus Lokiarchaeia archaeon]
MSLNELTEKLEYYNAKSTFFQAVSRGKDPKAETPSEVFLFDLKRYECSHLLNFNVSTPEIKNIEEYNQINNEIEIINFLEEWIGESVK